ncbi:uncharacterized protein METZ01_LOCUS86542, partial [marine metagenome]|jgi:hypothetical protein
VVGKDSDTDPTIHIGVNLPLARSSFTTARFS